MKKFILIPFLFIQTLIFAQLGNQIIFDDPAYALTSNPLVKTQIVDVNNDGLNDIVILKSDTFFLAENTGSSFMSPRFLLAPPTPITGISLIHWEDVTNDGFPELFLVREEWILNAFIYHYVFINQQNGNMSSTPVTIGGHTTADSGTPALYITDIDGDGDKDVSFASYSGAGGVSPTVHLNNGNATSWTLVSTPSKLDYYPYRMHDFDNDGTLDIITANPIRVFKFFKGLGGNNYAPEANIAGGFGPIVDIDNDGDLDQIGDGIKQYLNSGTASFSTLNISTATNRKFHEYADLDKDGILDIVGSNNSNVYWYKGLASGGYSAEKLLGQVATTVLAIKDANGDGVPDFYSLKNNKLHLHLNFLNSAFQLSGQLFYDLNQNAVKDPNESTLPFLGVNISPNAGKVLSSDGTFKFNTDSGRYVVTYDSILNWTLTTDSASYTTDLSSSNAERDSLEFGFYPSQIVTSVKTSLIGGFPRCDQSVVYWFSIKNEGTSNPSGRVELHLDDSIQYLASPTPPDSISGQTLFWNYDSLDFFEVKRWRIAVMMPDFNSFGDTLISSMEVKEIVSGSTVYTTSDTLQQELRCS